MTGTKKPARASRAGCLWGVQWQVWHYTAAVSQTSGSAAFSAESLAQHFRDKIRSGVLRPGDKLPSMNEIVRQYRSSKGVVQQAMVKLRADGLIESRHGAGSYVRDTGNRVARHVPAQMLRTDRLLTTRSVDEVPAPPAVAAAFGIEQGTPMVVRRSTATHSGRVVHTEDCYLPTGLAHGTRIVYTDPGEGGVYARLADQGAAVTSVTERVRARPATAQEAGTMQMKTGAALVLEITRWSFSGSRVVENAVTVMDAGISEVFYEVPLGST